MKLLRNGEVEKNTTKSDIFGGSSHSVSGYIVIITSLRDQVLGPLPFMAIKMAAYLIFMGVGVIR